MLPTFQTKKKRDQIASQPDSQSQERAKKNLFNLKTYSKSISLVFNFYYTDLLNITIFHSGEID